MLRISPRGSVAPAVLVGSHYDSALGSPGAADAAVPISIALEVARVAVAAAAEAAAKGNDGAKGSNGARGNNGGSASTSLLSPAPPSRAPLRSPLLLVLNGGEESLMLGSAAFMLEKEGEAAMEGLELSPQLEPEQREEKKARKKKPHSTAKASAPSSTSRARGQTALTSCSSTPALFPWRPGRKAPLAREAP